MRTTLPVPLIPPELPLRILVCSVPGQLREETVAALREHAFSRGVELFYSTLAADDPYAYGREIASHWQDAALNGLDLAIVEPDIIVRPDVIDAFLTCDCVYGGFPYSWRTDVGVALGCTRWRSSFIRRYPDLFVRANRARVSWRQLDVVVQRHYLVREHGEQPHLCGPEVVHLNESKALVEGASREPLRELPAW